MQRKWRIREAAFQTAVLTALPEGEPLQALDKRPYGVLGSGASRMPRPTRARSENGNEIATTSLRTGLAMTGS